MVHSGSFKEGNKAAQGMSDEAMVDLFYDMLDWAADGENEALSVEDVFIHFKMPKRTFYTRCQRNEELKGIKEIMRNVIKARVNKGAVKNNYASAPSIWRLKQLGERDSEARFKHEHSGTTITEHKVVFCDFTEEKDE